MTQEELEKRILVLARIHAASHDETVKAELEKLRKQISEIKERQRCRGHRSLPSDSLQSLAVCQANQAALPNRFESLRANGGAVDFLFMLSPVQAFIGFVSIIKLACS